MHIQDNEITFCVALEDKIRINPVSFQKETPYNLDNICHHTVYAVYFLLVVYGLMLLYVLITGFAMYTLSECFKTFFYKRTYEVALV